MNIKFLFTLFLFFELGVICCAKYFEIGIYSNCTDRDNRTQLNIDAGLVSDFNREIIDDLKRSYYNATKFPEYHVYDVCDNYTLLAEITQNLILDENLNIEKKEKNHSYSSIIVFFMYTPIKMTTFVKNVFTRIPVYDIDHRIQMDGSVYNPVDDFLEPLVSLVEFTGFERLTLISLTTTEFPFLAYYRKTIQTLQKKERLS